MEISEQEYKELKSHSQMLGIIGTYVEEFCNEEDTALIGVKRLLADYYVLKGENMNYQLNQEL
jgi:hypothetical protein